MVGPIDNIMTKFVSFFPHYWLSYYITTKIIHIIFYNIDKGLFLYFRNLISRPSVGIVV